MIWVIWVWISPRPSPEMPKTIRFPGQPTGCPGFELYPKLLLKYLQKNLSQFVYIYENATGVF